MDTTIQPLNAAQQSFLQRLIALHFGSNDDLQNIWNKISETYSHNTDPLGRDLNDTLSIINRSLKPAFGLEIRSVSLHLKIEKSELYHSNDDNDDDDDAPVVYHAIVNCHGDYIAKTFGNTMSNKDPHVLALFRLIVERFVEKASSVEEEVEEKEEDENKENDSEVGIPRRRRKRARRRGPGSGCQSSLSRIDILNMRMDLKGAHEGKLTDIGQVESAINLFESQGWLVPASRDTCGGKTSAKSSRQKRSEDKRGAPYLQLGPRAYMEFPGFLQKAGMDEKRLPQFILH